MADDIGEALNFFVGLGQVRRAVGDDALEIGIRGGELVAGGFTLAE